MRFWSVMIGVVVTLVLLAPAFLMSDESSAATCDGVRVYVENEGGGYDLSVVDGVSTVRGAIEAALADQGKTMVLNDRGNIRSVDGRELDDSHYWRVHQWLPLGTSGWGMMAFDPNSDGMMASGSAYCLHVSTLSNVDGTNVYSVPDFKPEAEGYVFIRFANGFAPDVPDMLAAFDAETRKEGFWLKGTGSSMGEVLKDAMDSNGFEIDLKSGMDANGNDLQSWINSMFGLGDVLIENDVWSYWSQWTWVDHEWYYNDWTLGFYDPAVYKYVECIYLISTEDPYAEGFVIDKGGPEPNPETDEIFCISSTPLVTFELEDGTVIARQYLEYGGTPDMSLVPEPEAPAGKIFAGWGDTTAKIKGDTKFVAKFDEAKVYLVRYWDESMKAVLYVDRVVSGSPSHFEGSVPYKPDSDGFSYEVAGWSKDLSSVVSDMDVTPVFKAVPKGAAVGDEFTSDGLRCRVTSLDPAKAAVIGADSAVGALVVPATVSFDGRSFSVDSIGARAFSGSGITSLVLRDAFILRSGPLGAEQDQGMKIGDEAFSGCKYLASVDTGPFAVIGEKAFQGCSALREIKMGYAETIASSAFSGCGALEHVSFSHLLKSVSADSFSVEFSDGAKKVTSASDLAGREFAGSGGKLTDSSAPAPAPSSGDNTMMYVAIGAAAVVALLVVAFLVMRSRKSR